MIKLNSSTMIYLPVNQVFDFVSRPENDFQWQYGILETAKLSEGINVMGTFFRSIGHLIGRRNLSTYEVTGYELNKKYKFKTLSGPLHSQTTYLFDKIDGNTRINISVKANMVNVFQVDERIMERGMKKQLKENLAMLKDVLEAPRTTPVPEPISLLI